MAVSDAQPQPNMQMMQPMMGGMHEGGSKLSASAQEFVPGGAGMPNGGAMDAYQSQFRFNVGAAEFTPTGQTVQPNAGSSGS